MSIENGSSVSEDQARLRYWSIEVFPAGEAVDGHGNEMLADIRRTGVTGVFQVCSSRVYMLEGGLRERDVRGLGGDLLADPVSERWRVFRGLAEREIEGPSVEVHPLPGVMSPVAQSTLSAVRRWLRFRGSPERHIGAVKVARRYRIQGAAGAEELERIAGKVLANVCIEQGYVQGLGRNDSLPTTLPVPPQRPFCVRHVSLSTLDEDGLRRLSREGHLFLSLEEMEAIRNHYRALKRDPTDLELETFAHEYPSSDLTAQAVDRLHVLRERRAEHEFQVAQYYERRKQPASAVLYYQSVVDQYAETSWAPKSAARLAVLEPLAQ